MKNPPIIKQISESFIKPNLNELNDVKDPYFLAPGDLAMLSAHYIQKGLLFYKPSTRIEEFSTEIFSEKLRDSLSRTLVLFYPLVGQLTTKINDDEHTCLIYVDCKKGPGVRFVHATVDLAVDDILSPTDVQPITKLFFDHHKAVNHDGHSSPLLSVQVRILNYCVILLW